VPDYDAICRDKRRLPDNIRTIKSIKEEFMKLTEMFSLKGKVALVTGGGRGIGKLIATGLAEAGADIILTSRKLKNLEETAGQLETDFKMKAVAIASDMAKEDTVESMLQEAVKKFGRVREMDDMKGAAVFLASPASAFITGHIMVVDGGQIAK
jgi:NAD(P)-dependent dehydrogenase (short-subunit alcohol dehydrogenase family)